MKTPYLDIRDGSRHVSRGDNSYESIPVWVIGVYDPESVLMHIDGKPVHSTLNVEVYDKSDKAGYSAHLINMSEQFEFLIKYPSGDVERIRYTGEISKTGSPKFT